MHHATVVHAESGSEPHVAHLILQRPVLDRRWLSYKPCRCIHSTADSVPHDLISTRFAEYGSALYLVKESEMPDVADDLGKADNTGPRPSAMNDTLLRSAAYCKMQMRTAASSMMLCSVLVKAKAEPRFKYRDPCR